MVLCQRDLQCINAFTHAMIAIRHERQIDSSSKYIRLRNTLQSHESKCSQDTVTQVQTQCVSNGN